MIEVSVLLYLARKELNDVVDECLGVGILRHAHKWPLDFSHARRPCLVAIII